MDAAIYPYELGRVFQEVADDLHKAGSGKQCANCGKPFNATRKFHGICRATYGSEIGVLSWSFALCRKCTREAKQSGGVPEKLKQRAAAEGELLLATPRGTA